MANAIYAFLGALGFTHPVHPILVHITIGAVVGAFVFGIIAWLFNRPVLYATARHGSVLGLVSAFFTVFMGFMDWRVYRGGEWLQPIIIKMILSGALFLILFAVVLLNRRVPKDSKIPLIFYTAAMVDVLTIGLFGGKLVYG